MSNKQRRRKLEQREREQARQVTMGKTLRLFLKSILFAVLVSVLVLVLAAVRFPGLGKVWVQMGIVFGAYLLAYPVLMSEFRVKRGGAPPGAAQDLAPPAPAGGNGDDVGASSPRPKRSRSKGKRG